MDGDGGLFGKSPRAAPTAVISRADDAGFLDDDPDDELTSRGPTTPAARRLTARPPMAIWNRVDLDAPVEGELEEPTAVFLDAADANAGSKKTALVLGAGLVVAIVARSSARSGCSAARTPRHRPTQRHSCRRAHTVGRADVGAAGRHPTRIKRYRSPPAPMPPGSTLGQA